MHSPYQCCGNCDHFAPIRSYVTHLTHKDPLKKDLSRMFTEIPDNHAAAEGWKEKMKISISVNKCNYCGKKVILIDDTGSCPGGCPGNMTELFVQSCKIPNRIMDQIKAARQDSGQNTDSPEPQNDCGFKSGPKSIMQQSKVIPYSPPRKQKENENGTH